jgi:2-polyprenyl-6-methoxyphenol hydroxylase-like FAD-dependent oxidoreductase
MPTAPRAQEMRDALTGKLIIRIPLGDVFFKRFGQRYGVTHRADIHVMFLKACQDSNLITLENSRRVESCEKHDDGVTVMLDDAERVDGRALIGCDDMWSQIRERLVGDGKPRVSGHIAYRSVLKREDVPQDLWRPHVILCAGPRTHLVHYTPAPRPALQSGRRFLTPTATKKARTPRALPNCYGNISGASGRKSCACSSTSRLGACGPCTTASR